VGMLLVLVSHDVSTKLMIPTLRLSNLIPPCSLSAPGLFRFMRFLRGAAPSTSTTCRYRRSLLRRRTDFLYFFIDC